MTSVLSISQSLLDDIDSLVFIFWQMNSHQSYWTLEWIIICAQIDLQSRKPANLLGTTANQLCHLSYSFMMEWVQANCLLEAERLIKLFHFLGMCSCTFSTCNQNLLALHPVAAQQLSSSPVNHINLCCLGCIPVVVVVLLFWSMPRGGVLLSRYEGGGGSFFPAVLM